MDSPFQRYLRSRNAAPTLADAAIALAVPVFPCDANKRPLTTHGFKDATTDPVQIRRMFANPAAVMIGVPTGAITGWVIIDVDVKDGAQGRAWLDANSHRLPQTRTIRTGTGGLHLYLRWPDQPVKNSASKIAPGIDVRGDGGYVIVPPSPGYAIADDAPVADAPDWLLAVLIPPAAPEPAPAPLLTPRRSADGISRLGRSTLDDRCDEIRFAPDGAKHRAINEAAFAVGGLVHAGHYTEGEAIAALRDALAAILPRCKDQRAAEKTLHRAFREGVNKPQNVDPPEEDRPLAPAVWNITQTMLARKKAPAPTAPLAVAPGLMDVPGALRLFVDHCERTALSPQPFLALAAGICLVGTLAGRRYRTTTDLRTNVYAIGVADSGAGKDHARRQIVRCLYAANLAHYLGGSDLASGAGLRSALQRHPSMLFQIDEFGDWLGSVLGEKASAHRKQIASMLKELYSSASGPWQGTEYADQSRDKGKPKLDIHQPNACLYGTTTPGQFWTAVAGTSLHDGLLARMLLFVSPCSYPDEREPTLGEPDADLIAALQAIAAGPGEGADGAGNLGALMLASTAPEPHTVPETAAATEARRALRQDQLKQQRQHEGTYVTAIAGRLAENAMKLALIRAISRDPAAPVIEAEDVAWGRAIAQHCVDTLLREAANNVADSDYERKVNRALGYIRKHGPVSSDALFRKGWRLPAKERDEILRGLVTSGMVIVIEHPPGPNGGKPSTRYAINTGNDGSQNEA